MSNEPQSKPLLDNDVFLIGSGDKLFKSLGRRQFAALSHINIQGHWDSNDAPVHIWDCMATTVRLMSNLERKGLLKCVVAEPDHMRFVLTDVGRRMLRRRSREDALRMLSPTFRRDRPKPDLTLYRGGKA